MDRISNLPEALLSRILSFLPTEESAMTSVLSKKWRYLFADRPNLDFNGSVIRFHPDTSEWKKAEFLRVFTRFVDRVLELQGNSTVDEFSLKCGDGVDPVCVTNWILNVLERGVSDLDLHFDLLGVCLPSEVFMSKSLVRLRIESKTVIGIDVEDVFLPKLKTLYINKLMLGKCGDYFEKVTSGCHVLEELVLINVYSDFWNRSVSSKTLKRLIMSCIDYDRNPDSVSFDTPSVVYLEYSDYVAGKYPKVNFRSLVEASIDLEMTSEQCAVASYEHSVGNVTDFLMGIRNVQTLFISAYTLEVLTFCCDHIPVFRNMIRLTIQSRKSGWESLPALLKKCPNLETLVFDELSHSFTMKCMDVDGCLCKFSGEVPTCLSSSPVKVLKILRFGEAGVEKETDLIKHFLETMPQLEQVTIYYDTLFDDDAAIELSRELTRFPTKASPSCEIQVFFGKVSS
ncbi:F-box/LRR-repeat protein At3g59250-like [Raphanus sativus]|uniref:F-box/LRR-repeat protein At3g59250-like n=1 Tax=Raphanus sativus TaxID=3726 RepID=A0A6J0K6K7_RAPSA|nr:F-box/LRR-repeat protein At3g59250-like [Raphanus sativus]